jgi:carbon storage regulator CsrA
MLVLSRARSDKVVFPSLNISVEILRIAGNRVRLGIDAPDEIPVLRHEIAEDPESSESYQQRRQFDRSKLNHTLRNRLHTAALGLHVLHRQFELEETDDAEATIFKIFNELKAIEDELEPAASKDPAPSTRDKSCRALLVEDDENERELLAGYLRMSGFQVDTAIDGLQAMVQLSKRERPDIVLMDMQMPRFDGRKTVSAIRANPDYRELKVFAVSGTTQQEAQVDVGSGGVDRWFAKPVNPQRLVAAIQNELTDACVPA